MVRRGDGITSARLAQCLALLSRAHQIFPSRTEAWFASARPAAPLRRDFGARRRHTRACVSRPARLSSGAVSDAPRTRFPSTAAWDADDNAPIPYDQSWTLYASYCDPRGELVTGKSTSCRLTTFSFRWLLLRAVVASAGPPPVAGPYPRPPMLRFPQLSGCAVLSCHLLDTCDLARRRFFPLRYCVLSN